MDKLKKMNKNIWIKDGLIVGAILVVLSILSYVFIDVEKVSFMFFISVTSILAIVPLVVLLVVFIRKYKSKNLNGKMTLKQGVIYGTLVSLVAAVVISVYSIGFNNFINPNYVETVQEATMENLVSLMESSGLPDSDIDKAVAEYEQGKAETIQKSKLISPVISIFTTSIYGLIIALIVSAIIKTKVSPFDEINENSEV